MIQVVIAKSEQQLGAVRELLYSYGVSRNFDGALGDYDKELATLGTYYAAPKGILLLAELDDTPVGCVAYRTIAPGICEMKRLYVHPAFRKKGIARQLCLTLIEKATTHSFQFMRLDTHPKMKAAQDLYRSLGFSPIERYNQNPIPGVLFFELSLPSI